ncbi:MAG: chemotaxis protein CheW [Deltaproteobacteria bacterium]|nr:chemotaxis protein CheW [Deltaproteobacteria bacterium]
MAVDLSLVRQVVRLGPVTPIPGAPAAVAGACHVGGRVVPVIDVGVLHGRGPSAPALGESGLLVEHGGQPAILLAGRVEAVARLPEGGAAEDSSRPLPLLDVAQLFDRVGAQVAEASQRFRGVTGADA